MTTEEHLESVVRMVQEVSGGLDRLDPPVMMGVYAAAIGMIVGAREEANFDVMNRAIDWMHRYCMERAQYEIEHFSGDVAESLERLQEVAQRPVEPRERFVPSPMTEAEIDALLEDDG